MSDGIVIALISLSGVALTATATILSVVITSRQTQKKVQAEVDASLERKLEIVHRGLKGSLYFQIKSSCLQCIADGYVDSDTLEATEDAWETYHNELGGNGYLNSLMSRLRELPLRKR